MEYQVTNILKGEIRVKNYKKEAVTLIREDTSTVKETLGVYIAPDATNEKQIAKLSNKAKMYAECINTGRVSRNYALHSLKSTI